MKVTTKSAIDISESLAAYLIASHIYVNLQEDALFEYRLKHVDTGKFSIADVYYRSEDTAIEVKSKAHGNSALKGVIQASMYKEQTENAVFCMQRPRRRKLADAIEAFADSHGVGVIWLDGIPTVCAERTIKNATGGNAKPFQLWKENRYTTTKRAIVNRSRSEWCYEFLKTLEQVIRENSDDIFDFAVRPDSEIGGFSDIY